MDVKPGGPRRRILPPIYFFAAMGLMAALDRFLPLVTLIEPPTSYLGWGPFALGVAVVIVGKLQFDRAGTTIKPFEASSTLVTQGIFAFSRNPIYLSMMLGLIGFFVVLGSLAPLVVVPVFFLIIRTGFVAVEEAMLEESFGDAYRDYKSRVRRWL